MIPKYNHLNYLQQPQHKEVHNAFHENEGQEIDKKQCAR